MKKFVSLFTGGGGLDLGLEAAGFDCVFASDIDYHSCKSLEANKVEAARRQKPFLKNANIIEKDVLDLSASEILSATGLAKGELDLLAGGPPCQAFSVFGKRKGRQDPRGLLAYQYKRLLSELAPKSFVFENVYGMLTIEGGQLFEDIKRELSNPEGGLNYELSVFRLNASDFGVPQFRDRVFIIGSRSGKIVSDIPKIFSEPGQLFAEQLPWRTVGMALTGLPSIGSDGWHNHIGRKHSQRIKDRYASMNFGERDSKTRINKLNPEKPSFAIIVGSDAGGGKGHIHPFEAREVTPRESARIQTFPDWWWFSGTSRHPIRQVGNAVPSLLGYAVGRAILSDLFSYEPNKFIDAVRLLDQAHLFTSEELDYLEAYDQTGQRNPRSEAI